MEGTKLGEELRGDELKRQWGVEDRDRRLARLRLEAQDKKKRIESEQAGGLWGGIGKGVGAVAGGVIGGIYGNVPGAIAGAGVGGQVGGGIGSAMGSSYS